MSQLGFFGSEPEIETPQLDLFGVAVSKPLEEVVIKPPQERKGKRPKQPPVAVSPEPIPEPLVVEEVSVPAKIEEVFPDDPTLHPGQPISPPLPLRVTSICDVLRLEFGDCLKAFIECQGDGQLFGPFALVRRKGLFAFWSGRRWWWPEFVHIPSKRSST